MDAPAPFHAQRHAHYQSLVARLDARDAAVAYTRLAVFALGCAGAWNAARNGWPTEPTLVLGALFVVLMVVHGRIQKSLAHARRGVAHHQAAQARLSETFDAPPHQGNAYADDAHPYARDLDLFGPGGVMERLNHTRTDPGEMVLARMLLTPVDAATARARQDAVREWEPLGMLRETLALCGEPHRAQVDVARLFRWVSRPDAWAPGAAVWHALALVPGAAGVGVLLGWMAGLNPGWWVAASLVVNSVVLRALQPRLESTLGTLHKPGAALKVLSDVMVVFLGQPLTAARNAECQKALTGPDGQTAADAVADLARRVERVQWRHNQFFALLGILMMWDVHAALRVEAWRKQHGSRVRGWVEATSELEALASLGAYAFENPAHVWPTFREGAPHVDADALAHPLLPAARAVPNDMRLVAPVRLLLVSGSNMSGKSTMLRAVGLNTVLAMCGTRVRATRMEVAPVALGCTMRVEDSLQAGRSRFMAELLRLKQVAELAQRGPLLFLLDEILHGTNSHDRLAGGEAYLRSLLGFGAAGMCTTHDLALARATQSMGDAAVNVHFRDGVKNGAMSFDHLMRPGVVDRSNALELMRMLGLEV